MTVGCDQIRFARFAMVMQRPINGLAGRKGAAGQ
jgi:hypothetical protein